MSLETGVVLLAAVVLAVLVLGALLKDIFWPAVGPEPEWNSLTGLRREGASDCFVGDWKGMHVMVVHRAGVSYTDGVGGARVEIPASLLATVEMETHLELVGDELVGESLEAAAADLDAIRSLRRAFRGALRIHPSNLVAELSASTIRPRDVTVALDVLRRLADLVSIPADDLVSRAVHTASVDPNARRRARAIRALTPAHARKAEAAAEAGLQGSPELRHASLLCLCAAGRKLTAEEEDWLAQNEPEVG